MRIIKKIIKWLMGLIIGLIVMVAILIIVCKIQADSQATPLAQAFNRAKTCYVNTYEVRTDNKPMRSFDGFASGLTQIIRGRVFYRVYTIDRREAATTEWKFLQSIVVIDEYLPRWLGDNVMLIYPGNDGYEYLYAPDCDDKELMEKAAKNK